MAFVSLSSAAVRLLQPSCTMAPIPPIMLRTRSLRATGPVASFESDGTVREVNVSSLGEIPDFRGPSRLRKEAYKEMKLVQLKKKGRRATAASSNGGLPPSPAEIALRIGASQHGPDCPCLHCGRRQQLLLWRDSMLDAQAKAPGAGGGGSFNSSFS